MSPAKMETFKVSASAVPGGWPRLVQQRIDRLKPGSTVTRADVVRVCGTTSSANHFIDQATREGLLVPTAWGEYRVTDADTLAILARIQHPAFRRFAAWARALEDVLFAAPRLWRDTHLNLEHAMVVVPIPKDRGVVGAPPQWDAFHMDLAGRETWQLILDDERVAAFEAPSILDVALLAWATRDGRWMEAADQLRARFTKKQQAHWEEMVVHTLAPDLAPRGRSVRRRVRMRPPHRRVLLVPPWSFELARETLRPELDRAGAHPGTPPKNRKAQSNVRPSRRDRRPRLEGQGRSPPDA